MCVWCQSLWDRAVAAGRARGIEEERKRCHGIAISTNLPNSLTRDRMVLEGVAMIANRIADAIAKETGK